MAPTYRAAVITLSDKGSAGERQDLSGAKVVEILSQAGFEISKRLILPDDRQTLAQTLAQWADSGQLDFIVTTGGTGFSPRDWTPEATLEVAERLVPGLAELMRLEGYKKTPRAMLSRGVAVIRAKTLIVNLPGSPKAVAENLSALVPILDHALEVLAGDSGDCARP
ncbi:MAG: MogA/MoaB family molybdenum cofactor biosynthesis protein [Deltaproteobacteria bacterium]|jgi:molybdenum cofactor synthesis domain-containing protein|nr:MogA/MoaB family molybdenum cofactor biosynthesis protein [Deltaproteobacteria bacterium]